MRDDDFTINSGLTYSDELVSDKVYSDFFRNPDVVRTFAETMDMTDSRTRKAVLNLTEGDQTALLTSLTSRLYDNIVAKVDDIDYGTIPDSKGDITKLENYDKIKECISLLHDILIEFKQDTAPIDEISMAVANIESRKDLFGRAFKLNIELPMIMYNNAVLTIVDAVSYMIATSIEFIKTPNRDSFDITLDKVSYSRTKNHMLYNNLKKFNKACKSKDLDKALDHIITSRAKGLHEGAVVGTVAGVLAVGGILVSLCTIIIPLLREMVFLFYHTRMRLSDFFDIQADLLQMNAHNLQNNKTMDDDEKEHIVSKQLKIVELFRKIANKISFTCKKAEVESTKDIAASGKKLKIDDIDTSGINNTSALF